MNTDFEVRKVPRGDFLYALNCRAGISDTGNLGAVENPLGNTMVYFQLPAGDNECNGSYADTLANSMIYFVWNELGSHQILRYYIDTNEIVVLFGTPILNFQRNKLITSIDLNNDLLYWTALDGNQPRKLNIVKSRTDKPQKIRICFGMPLTTGRYDLAIQSATSGFSTFHIIAGSGQTLGDFIVLWIAAFTADLSPYFTIENDGTSVVLTSLTTQDVNDWSVTISRGLDLPDFYVPINYYDTINTTTEPFFLNRIKAPFTYAPIVSNYITDSVGMINNIHNKFFQFRLRYIYDDAEQSVLSPISDIANADNDTRTNAIKVDFTLTSGLFNPAIKGLFSHIEIFVRSTDKIDDTATLNDQPFKFVDRLDQYQFTGIYIFDNNSYLESISEAEDALLFHPVPLKSQAQVDIKNRSFITCDEEGYEPVPIHVDFETQNNDIVAQTTYPITGSIFVTKFGTSTKVGINGGRFGDGSVSYDVNCPAEHLVVYAAGTKFSTFTTTSGVSEDFTLNLPPGRYLIRIASHLCQDSGLGNLYGLDYMFTEGEFGPYQKTSTFVRSYDGVTGVREAEIEVTTSGFALGDFVVDSVPDNTSGAMFGYVLDTDAKPPITTTVAYGNTIENTSITVKTYQVTGSAFVNINTLSLAAATRLLTIVTATNHGLAINDVVAIGGNLIWTGTPYSHLSCIVTSIISPTSFVCTSQDLTTSAETGTGGRMIKCTPVSPFVIEADHNGFFYTYLSNMIVYNGGYSYYSGYCDYFLGDVTGIVGGGLAPIYFTGNYSADENYVTSPSNMYQVMPMDNIASYALQFNPFYGPTLEPISCPLLGNTNAIVTSTFRTHITGTVIDQEGQGIANIAVAIVGSGRPALTSADGTYSILVYANNYNSGTSQNFYEGTLVFGKYSDPSSAGYIAFVVNFIDISFIPFSTFVGDNPRYNNLMGYIVSPLFVLNAIVGTLWQKHGELYKVGIVYYDEYLRSTGVNDSPECSLQLPYFDNPSFRGQLTQLWSVYHRPPVWAKSWQWVRTKGLHYGYYLQLFINGVKYFDYPDPTTGNETETGSPSALTNKAKLSIEFIDLYLKANPTSIYTGYTFNKGDRVRILTSGSDLASQVYIDTIFDAEVLGTESISGKPYLVIQWKSYYAAISDDAEIEIYSPNKLLEANLYYEFSQQYPIINPGTVNAVHGGQIQNQSTGGLPATGNFPRSWDTYYSTSTRRNLVFDTQFLFESYNAFDTINSKMQPIGRVYIKSDQIKKTFNPNKLRFSNTYIQGSLINGLSYFEPLNQVTLPAIYGGIMRLFYADNTLTSIQKDATYYLLVDEAFVQTVAEDSSVQNITDKVVGGFRKIDGIFGTVHPESCFQNRGVVVGYDMNRGCFWMYNSQRTRTISGVDETSGFNGKFHTYAMTLSRYLESSLADHKFVKAVYDREFEEYLWGIQVFDDPNNSNVFTAGGNGDFEAGNISGLGAIGNFALSASAVQPIYHGGGKLKITGNATPYVAGTEYPITISTISVTPDPDFSKSYVIKGFIRPNLTVKQYDVYFYGTSLPVGATLLVTHRLNDYYVAGGYDTSKYYYIEAILTLPIGAAVPANVSVGLAFKFPTTGDNPGTAYICDVDYITAKEDIHYLKAETVAFATQKQGWTSFYSIFADMYNTVSNKFIAFKRGYLYNQNANSVRNNFFGIQYTSQLKFVANSNPSQTQVFQTIDQKSNIAWDVISLSTLEGQESSLIIADFENKEGVYWAPILRDINTPNISNPIFEGDEMRSSVLVVTLETTNTGYVKISSVDINGFFSMFVQ